MSEMFTKMKIINIIAMIIIVTCSSLVLIIAFKKSPVPSDSMKVIETYFNMCLVGLVGWAFTRSQDKPATS